MLGAFPNTYTFSKRMGEHLILDFVKNSSVNNRPLPLMIIRPSIISASLSEPVPGWTDSIGLIGGIYMVAGLGILRELPCDANSIGD